MRATEVFAGAHAVVTGGSSGIGLACAEALAARGAHVAIVARDPGKLESAAAQVEAARLDATQRVLSASADLATLETTERAFAQLASEGFAPDVLINSAGVILPGEFSTMPYEHLRANMACGYWSVVNPCRAAVPSMIERGRGHIVNVSSVAGFLGIYGYTGYAAAKYAVVGFSEALRFELRPHGISVSVVLPPDTDTPGLEAERAMRPRETEAVAGNIKAIAPAAVARAVMRGMERGSFHIIPDARSRLYFRLKGLLPELFFAVVDSDVRKAQRDHRD
ncbi:MAG TPA: SDR family oxidoreductase [Coriobacteriia bacterium]|nr:SDR family oxidoreductase [Coriobacteriia bacterium]